MAIRSGQFGQTLGTGDYYFDEIEELFSFLKGAMAGQWVSSCRISKLVRATL
jgi:hypothetical protein